MGPFIHRYPPPPALATRYTLQPHLCLPIYTLCEHLAEVHELRDSRVYGLETSAEGLKHLMLSIRVVGRFRHRLRELEASARVVMVLRTRTDDVGICTE